ncbi:MAG: hypothetical protein IKK00_07670 [Oscillospiraceae bacterium]|nr:hypothetical protein [Oscillospiraceae bacterium]
MNVALVIAGYLFSFIIGALMRYASRKWDKPLKVAVCLIFALIVFDFIAVVKDSTLHAYLQDVKLRAVGFVIMMLGVLAADIIYRIRNKE